MIHADMKAVLKMERSMDKVSIYGKMANILLENSGMIRNKDRVIYLTVKEP